MLTRPAPIDIPLYQPPSVIISFGLSPEDNDSHANGVSQQRPTITRKYCRAFAAANATPSNIAGVCRGGHRVSFVFDFFSQGSIRSSRGTAAVTTDGTRSGAHLLNHA